MFIIKSTRGFVLENNLVYFLPSKINPKEGEERSRFLPVGDVSHSIKIQSNKEDPGNPPINPFAADTDLALGDNSSFVSRSAPLHTPPAPVIAHFFSRFLQG
ncbi:hypothetical protein CDAR_398881 [Caerostris darwini]|uniref:Uncharacterized protein n=1 Tax=Caerostris darwini TaxID=1538125 RepID=A0AAV4V7S4_9ARAC|nr:hypothetical protein CDAR_398881 [Caerostris darwini]